MIGPIVNSASTLIGGVVGALLGNRLSECLRTELPLVFGVISMAMGVTMIVKMHSLPAVIISILLGAIIGAVIALETKINFAAGKARVVIDKLTPSKKTSAVSPDEFVEKFVAVLILFCASGTGIFGSMNEGITGDSSLLLSKSVLDLLTATIFAAALGMSVAAIAIPQFIIQMTLFFLGQFLLPLTTPEMVNDFSGCGGIIMLATGFRIAGIKSFPIANLLPALFIIMPISNLWARYVL
jgi:uncharacterized membrane protein YqgA involved in biofilm formation